MRRDVLYEYDLPVELLDDIGDTEEVLEVFYARSDKKDLLPILFSRERIIWAYPETSTVYRVYEMQYIDVLSVLAKYVTLPFPTLRFNAIDGQTYVFHHIQDSKEEMRGRLITLCGILKNKVSGNWRVWHKKLFMVDKYLLDRQDHDSAENIAGLPLCEPPSARGLDDVFEDKLIPGKGCFESNEVLFSHFPGTENEEVFEDFTPGAEKPAEDQYASADAKVALIVGEVEANIQKSRETAGTAPAVSPQHLDDTVIYSTSSGKTDDQQWGVTNDGGDAVILETLRKAEQIILPKKQVYDPKDDDSIVYPSANDETVVITPLKKPRLEFESINLEARADVTSSSRLVDINAPTAVPLVSWPSYEIDDNVVETLRQKTPFEEANKDVVAHVLRGEPQPKPPLEAPRSVFTNQEAFSPFLKASNLQPRVGFDSAVVDKLLEKLQHLRDSGVISEEEYKERSLMLFRSE